MTIGTRAEFALLDTNVLVYGFDEQSEFHGACRRLLACAAGHSSETRLCATPQVLAEFFAVVTNPRRVRNPRTAQEAAHVIEHMMALPNMNVLPIPVDIVSRWIALVRKLDLRGARVFDAQLAATCLANGVRRVYTYDRDHFELFSELEVVTPG